MAKITGDEVWRAMNKRCVMGARKRPDGRYDFWVFTGNDAEGTGYWSGPGEKWSLDVIVSYGDTWCEPHKDFYA